MGLAPVARDRSTVVVKCGLKIGSIQLSAQNRSHPTWGIALQGGFRVGGAALVFTVVPNPNRKNVGETVSAMGITIRMHLSRGGVEVTEVMDPVGNGRVGAATRAWQQDIFAGITPGLRWLTILLP